MAIMQELRRQLDETKQQASSDLEKLQEQCNKLEATIAGGQMPSEPCVSPLCLFLLALLCAQLSCWIAAMFSTNLFKTALLISLHTSVAAEPESQAVGRTCRTADSVQAVANVLGEQVCC